MDSPNVRTVLSLGGSGAVVLLEDDLRKDGVLDEDGDIDDAVFAEPERIDEMVYRVRLLDLTDAGPEPAD